MAKENGTKQAPQKHLSDADLKKVLAPLFKEYDAANAKVLSSRQALADAMQLRSAIVQRIAEIPGGRGTGPYMRAGKELKIMSRTSKTEPEKPATYYFRGETEVDAFTVD